jgi:hypothetical protein
LRVFVYTFSAMTAFANAFLLVYAGLFSYPEPDRDRTYLSRPDVRLHGR